MKFSDKHSTGKRVKPYSASIDGINSRLGYSKENTRLVCLIANIGMNQFGEGALLSLLSGLIKQKRQSADDLTEFVR